MIQRAIEIDEGHIFFKKPIILESQKVVRIPQIQKYETDLEDMQGCS
jgi:hypothetical protein